MIYIILLCLLNYINQNHNLLNRLLIDWSDMLLVSLAAPATLTQLLTTAWVLPTG